MAPQLHDDQTNIISEIPRFTRGQKKMLVRVTASNVRACVDFYFTEFGHSEAVQEIPFIDWTTVATR